MIAPEVIGPVERVPNDAAVAKRLVVLAVFANIDVEVALVEVEFRAVKFCSVVDARESIPPFRNARPDTVIAVEEAYGSTDEVVDVAVKLDASTLPATVIDDEANS